MKILDRYILTSYLKTFLSVFVILMLIFVLQTIWLYIKELAGKDLDIIVVGKFLLYFAPKLIPLVLPLTILLASIMVFGNFAENYEFAAMKSTGISLQRAMAGLSIFILGLAIVTFFFTNNVIPWAEFNSHNLRKNIAKLKPAMVIAEGRFNEIGNITIKVDEKSGDRGQYLKNVILHQKSGALQGNHITIVSNTGELKSKEDSDVLRLVLYDGNYYDDTPPKEFNDRKKRPFKKSDFEIYTINVDLSEINDVNLDEKNVSDKYNMLNIRDLSYAVDSLKVKRDKEYSDISQTLYGRSNISVPKEPEVKPKDSLRKVLEIFDPNRSLGLVEIALNTVKSTKQIISNKDKALKNSNIWLNKHIMALHEKLALGFACIILFFVGAPLGALIRKGGIGLPMVIAILLFLTYHFIGIFAKNSARDGSFNPVLAPWFSTIIMLPLSIYLTRRATADQGLFEFDTILDPFRKYFSFKSSKAHDDGTFSELEKKLQKFNNKELLHIVKHGSHEFTDHGRDVAFSILDERGMTLEEFSGFQIDYEDTFNDTKQLKKDFQDYSKFSFVFYAAAVILLILFFVFKNNKLTALTEASLQLSLVCGFVFLLYYILSQLKLRSVYNLNAKPTRKPNLLVIILGIILYPLIHIFLKGKLAQDYKQITLHTLK